MTKIVTNLYLIYYVRASCVYRYAICSTGPVHQPDVCNTLLLMSLYVYLSIRCQGVGYLLGVTVVRSMYIVCSMYIEFRYLNFLVNQNTL